MPTSHSAIQCSQVPNPCPRWFSVDYISVRARARAPAARFLSVFLVSVELRLAPLEIVASGGGRDGRGGSWQRGGRDGRGGRGGLGVAHPAERRHLLQVTGNNNVYLYVSNKAFDPPANPNTWSKADKIKAGVCSAARSLKDECSEDVRDEDDGKKIERKSYVFDVAKDARENGGAYEKLYFAVWSSATTLQELEIRMVSEDNEAYRNRRGSRNCDTGVPPPPFPGGPCPSLLPAWAEDIKTAGPHSIRASFHFFFAGQRSSSFVRTRVRVHRVPCTVVGSPRGRLSPSHAAPLTELAVFVACRPQGPGGPSRRRSAPTSATPAKTTTRTSRASWQGATPAKTR